LVLSSIALAMGSVVGLAVLIGVLLYFMHKQFELFLQRKREDKPYSWPTSQSLSITIVLMLE
ncbi:hypothetical protein, partial [Citrobacter youngae]|uniref:hypothetical protein n=1 Tax=Citrobacter youngae TaxID=133448 RepID=UPI00195371E9